MRSRVTPRADRRCKCCLIHCSPISEGILLSEKDPRLRPFVRIVSVALVRANTRKICSIASSAITNLTWTDPGSNPGVRGHRQATNRPIRRVLQSSVCSSYLTEDKDCCKKPVKHNKYTVGSIEFFNVKAGGTYSYHYYIAVTAVFR